MARVRRDERNDNAAAVRQAALQAARRAGAGHDAEDVATEAWIAAHKKGAETPGLAAAIARGTTLNLRRKRARQSQLRERHGDAAPRARGGEHDEPPTARRKAERFAGNDPELINAVYATAHTELQWSGPRIPWPGIYDIPTVDRELDAQCERAAAARPALAKLRAGAKAAIAAGLLADHEADLRRLVELAEARLPAGRRRSAVVAYYKDREPTMPPRLLACLSLLQGNWPNLGKKGGASRRYTAADVIGKELEAIRRLL